MLDRLKSLLEHMINVLAVVVLFVCTMAYVWVTGVLTTAVVNAWRLYAYVGLDTGMGIVFLIILLGWVPAYFLLNYTRPRR